MLTKLEEIHCPLCSKVTGMKTHQNEIEKDEHKILYGEICGTCKGIMAEGVTLRCLGIAGEVEKDWKMQKVPCCTVTVVTKEILEKHGFIEWVDFELGGFMDVAGCPMCSESKAFEFWKPITPLK